MEMTAVTGMRGTGFPHMPFVHHTRGFVADDEVNLEKEIREVLDKE